MQGKKTKVFISILIMLTLTLVSITINADLEGIQLSPQIGAQKWQTVSETNKIAYLTAIGSALFVVLVFELILLRRIDKRNHPFTNTNQIKQNNYN